MDPTYARSGYYSKKLNCLCIASSSEHQLEETPMKETKKPQLASVEQPFGMEYPQVHCPIRTLYFSIDRGAA